MGLLFSKLSSLFDQFADKPMNIVMLGLDNAGKTTVMYKLKLNETVTTIPTIGFNVETVTPKKGLTFTMWDVGGQDRIRGLWNYYFQSAQGLIYVVDSNDELRFLEAKKELHKILESGEMRHVPVVVLANKQDLPNAADCSKIADVLELQRLHSRRWHIQATCAHNGAGVYEAMDRLAELTKDYIRNQQ